MVDDEPAAGLDLLVELPGGPAGVTSGDRQRATGDASVLSAVLLVQNIGDHLRSGGSIVTVVPENPRDGSADAAIGKRVTLDGLQVEIVGVLARLKKELGVTVLVVAHDLNPLLGVLDSAIYLLDGHAHHAPLDKVVDSELLTHMYGTTIQVAYTLQGELYMKSQG